VATCVSGCGVRTECRAAWGFVGEKNFDIVENILRPNSFFTDNTMA
jgi:hypothetical protein